jgi:hypothetical protein
MATRSKDDRLITRYEDLPPPRDLSDPVFQGITEEDIKDLDLESMPPCMVGGKPYDPDEVELTYALEAIREISEKHEKERQERERRERERQQPETKPSKS